MAIALEELILQFSIDSDGLEKGLDSVSARARAKAREIEGMAIAPKVDLKGLHDLNKLLDIKQRHIKETADFAKRTPIVMGVDVSQVKEARKELQGLKSDLGVSGGNQTISIKVEHDYKVDVRESNRDIAHQIKDLGNGLRDIVAAVKSTKQGIVGKAVGGLIGAVTSTPLAIARGALEGVGRESISKLSKSLGNEFDSILTPLIGSMDTLGKRTAKSFASKVEKSIGKASDVYDKFLEIQSVIEVELENSDKKLSDGQKKVLVAKKRKERDIRPSIQSQYIAFANTPERVEDILIQSVASEKEQKKRTELIRQGKKNQGVQLSDQANKAISQYQTQLQQYSSRRATLQEPLEEANKQIALFGKEAQRINALINKLSSEGDVWGEIPSLRQALDENALKASPFIKTRNAILEELNGRAEQLEQLDSQAKSLQKKANNYLSSYKKDVIARDNLSVIVKKITGKEIKQSNLPSIVIDSSLRKGAEANYDVLRNQINVPKSLYDRISAPDFATKKTDENAFRVTAHELTHAVDTDFGSDRGLASYAKGRTRKNLHEISAKEATDIQGKSSLHGFKCAVSSKAVTKRTIWN
jgi:hypothetical protein